MTLLVTMDRMVFATPFSEWCYALHARLKAIITAMSEQQGALDDHVDDVSDAVDQATAITAASLNPHDMQRFKEVMLPLLDSAYSFARYLVRDASGAEDVVQEVYLRALRAFPQYRGGDARSWLLAIVRNCCATWIARNKRHDERMVDDEEALTNVSASADDGHPTPEQQYDIQQRAKLIRELIETLSEPLREVLILREIEDLSYGEIAGIMKTPVGTVMSRLARARSQLFASCQQRGLVMS